MTLGRPGYKTKEACMVTRLEITIEKYRVHSP